jgi:hypothetical protein
MPLIRSTTSKHRAYVIAVILLLSKIMPTCSRYTEKGLVYIIIAASSSHQSSSYSKCTKLNMRLSYNIQLISVIEYIFLAYSITLYSLQLPYLIYFRVLYLVYY